MDMSFRALAALCSLAMAMNAGCRDSNGNTGSDSSVNPLMNGGTSDSITSAIVPETTEESDYIPAYSADTEITFSAAGAAVSGKGASASGSIVTITSAGVYGISGECSDGRIIIDADKDSEVTLILDGLTLSSTDGCVIDCEKAAKLYVTLSDGSRNILSDAENYSFEDGEDEPDAALFCRSDMVINGSGSLEVTSLYNDGIKCKDGLKICGGSITVNAVGDGIVGKDYLIFANGTLDITSGKDGLKSSNDTDETLGYIHIQNGEINILSDNDAVQAETELIINGGSITAVSGGGSATVEHTSSGSFGGGGWGGKFSLDGSKPFDFDNMTSDTNETTESMKGLKAGTAVTVSGGSIDIDSADDSIHSNGSVLISYGTLKLSSGDDGIHADDNVTINNGEIYIVTSYEGIEGLSIDINGGSIEVNAYDDGLNAAGGDNGNYFGFGSSSEYYISISGGNITVNADGDGLDSNGSMAMSGGTLVVFGSSSGDNGALDYESSFAVSGGTLIALGSAGMSQTPSTLSQPCLSVNSAVSEGSIIEVRDEDGNVILSVETPKQAQLLIFSTDKFVVGEVYSVYADDTLLSEITATDGVSGSTGGGMGGFGGNGGNGGFGGNGDFGGFGGKDFDDIDFGDTPPEAPEGGKPIGRNDGFSTDGFMPEDIP